MATVNNIPALTFAQQRFSLINLSAEIRIVDNLEVADVLAGKKDDISLYKRTEGQLWMERYIETLPINSKPKEVIKKFLVDPNTHTYDAIAFSPLTTPNTTLNYWTGPTTKPKQGNWKVIRSFLYEVICDEDQALYDYFIQFLAHMLKQPEEKPGISIVMLSNSGCGKGTVFQLLNAIWSKTTLEVADINHVIGTFNAALEKNYVICMDESLFKGDKASMERLKSAITEPTIRVEQKYQPSRTINSYHRFFAASNSEHFANIPIDDRRFVFIRVSDRKQQDLNYFNIIHKAINDSSVIGAMVYDLFTMDLTKFNVRRRPFTKEHLKQRLQSLDGFERFWFEVLETGKFRSKSEGLYGSLYDSEWDDSIFLPTQTIINCYTCYDKNATRYEPIQTQKVAAVLTRICPSAKSSRVKNTSGKQERGYQLPNINAARKEFELAIKSPINWQSDSTEIPTELFNEDYDVDHYCDLMRECQ